MSCHDTLPAIHNAAHIQQAGDGWDPDIFLSQTMKIALSDDVYDVVYDQHQFLRFYPYFSMSLSSGSHL